MLDVTLNGTFRCTRAALRQMVAQGHGGAVVNNASVLGWRAQPGQAHYAAAKAGVMALTRCAALDVAEHGIRVNAVAPSLAMHPFLAKVTSEDVLAELVGREAFGRSAEPWEVANVMVFLASDYASYLTGEVISVSSQHPSGRVIAAAERRRRPGSSRRRPSVGVPDRPQEPVGRPALVAGTAAVAATVPVAGRRPAAARSGRWRERRTR